MIIYLDEIKISNNICSIFRTQKTQNGTAAGKVVLTTIDAPSPVKTVTLSSENGCTPYHKQEDSNSNKETELKQRGKFYLDGYLGLALEFVDPDELVRKFKKSEIIERPENFAAEGTLWADVSLLDFDQIYLVIRSI